MNTSTTAPIETSSRILAHLNDEFFSVLGAFILERNRSVNLMNHWKLRRSLRNLGYHVFMIEVVSKGYEDKGSSLYFFVPNLSYEKALELGKGFDQEAILAKENEEVLVLGRVSPKEGDGHVIRRFSASSLSESAFIEALIQLFKICYTDCDVNSLTLYELTRVPLHCSHQLEYPYARCYTFK